MSTSLFLLQCLLYMNPKIGLNYTYTTERCFVFNSTIDLPYCNRVCHRSIPTTAEIQEIKSYFGTQRFTWVVDVTDTETIVLLEQNNLRHVGSFPLMIVDLNAIQLTQHDPEIVIQSLNLHDENDKKLWAQIVAQSFDPVNAQTTSVGLFTMLNHLANHIIAPNLKIYWGYYQGKPVATCCAMYHGDIASIHWVGTLPEFRKHGLGSAVTQAALDDAKNNGCKRAILFASPLGKPVYERFGFKELAIYNMYGNY